MRLNLRSLIEDGLPRCQLLAGYIIMNEARGRALAMIAALGVADREDVIDFALLLKGYFLTHTLVIGVGCLRLRGSD